MSDFNFGSEENNDDNDSFKSENNFRNDFGSNQEVKKKDDGKVFGIIGFVLGIVSIVGCCCWLSFLAIPGLVLSIIQMVKNPKNGFGIAGLVLNIIGVLISILMIVGLIVAMNDPESLKQLEEILSTTFNFGK